MRWRKKHIIALKEVIPKNYRYERDLIEYVLEGYEIVERNIQNEDGRGLLTYVKSGVNFNTVDFKTHFCEHCCIDVCCSYGNLLVMSMHRSPNSDIDNNNNLLQLMQEVSDYNVQYKIMLGDFNLPRIRWSNYTTEGGTEDCNTRFIEKVRDCFLTQHIQDVTRIRGDSQGNTLDLLFTNDESIIEEIKNESPLGKSDHVCILVKANIKEQPNHNKKQAYLYEKADYQLMKSRLNIDWEQYLGQESHVNGKWIKFKDKLLETIEECVPKKQMGMKPTLGRRNEK